MPPLRHLPTTCLLALLVSPLPALAVHPHYQRLLREGSFALERGEAAEAVRDLQLACFGYLEEPPALADCLMRLALAQGAVNDESGFRATFRRIVEVEERFHAYSRAASPPELRAGFEAEVAARIPPAILSETEAFARLAPQETESAAAAVETAPEDAAAGDAGSEMAVVPPPNGEAPSPEPLDPDDETQLARARSLVAEAATRGDLDEPWRLARDVADRNPQSREAQELAAVIAYRGARWQDAVTYFRRAGDPAESPPEEQFYFAVSLYEAGNRVEAAEMMKQSFPKIDHTPFVLSYRDKILGPSGDGG